MSKKNRQAHEPTTAQRNTILVASVKFKTISLCASVRQMCQTRKNTPKLHKKWRIFMQLIFFTPSTTFKSSYRQQHIYAYVVVCLLFYFSFKCTLMMSATQLSAGGDCVLVLLCAFNFKQKNKKFQTEQQKKTCWFFVPNLQWPIHCCLLSLRSLEILLNIFCPFCFRFISRNISIVILFKPNEFHELWHFSGILVFFCIARTK